MMQFFNRIEILGYVQHTISFVGILVILSGVILALSQYIFYLFRFKANVTDKIHMIRLELSRCLILGLEFIVAADLIATTTTPDYYSVGIVRDYRHHTNRTQLFIKSRNLSIKHPKSIIVVKGYDNP